MDGWLEKNYIYKYLNFVSPTELPQKAMFENNNV